MTEPNKGLSSVLDMVGHTDPGVVRPHNEDSIANDVRYGLVVLADGMGGYNAGEVASGMATTILMKEIQESLDKISPSLPDPEKMAEAGTYAARILSEKIDNVNSEIFSASQMNPQFAGMGTTLVVALFYGRYVTVAHIGDSRMYRLRGQEFVQITKDHSLLQEQIDSGIITPEEARFSQNKNLVTRALGIDPVVEAEVHDHQISVGDIYLLCSDGLSDMLTDEEIGVTLHGMAGNLELAAYQLVQMANDHGGRDNISVILIKVLGRLPGDEGMVRKMFGWFRS